MMGRWNIKRIDILLGGYAVLALACTAELILPSWTLAVTVPPQFRYRPFAALPKPAPLAPEGNFASISTRPLFNEGRRPYPTLAPPPPPPPAPTLTGYRLVGIVLSGDVRLAMIQLAASGKIRRVKAGDHLGRWVVEQVGPSGVAFKSGNHTGRLSFRPKTSSHAPGDGREHHIARSNR